MSESLRLEAAGTDPIRSGRSRPTPWLVLLLAGTMTMAGCVNLAANLIHAVQGNNRPAEFGGLEGQRVAIVCATDSGLDSDATNLILSNNIHAALSINVKDIEVVRHSEIEQWLDVHSWEQSDYVEIGKGVKADRLLAVELVNLKLKNGQTLYRGEADITVTVYDIENGGRILYRKQIPEFAFPASGGKPVTETSENKFRSFFLAVVTRKIAGLFYEVDATADYALDATVSSF